MKTRVLKTQTFKLKPFKELLEKRLSKEEIADIEQAVDLELLIQLKHELERILRIFEPILVRLYKETNSKNHDNNCKAKENIELDCNCAGQFEYGNLDANLILDNLNFSIGYTKSLIEQEEFYKKERVIKDLNDW